jgi:glycosyltransferase involved in cell wall biosynthesis
VISLSKALLVGCVRRLKNALGSLISVTLQGEDSFLDALPANERQNAWDLVGERLAEADVIVSPSRYYADRMAARLNLSPERIQVVPNGIHLAGWRAADQPPNPPAVGFLARMCPEKGLNLLVDAFIRIRRGGRIPELRLRVAGGLGPTDEAFVETQKRRLHAEGLLGDVEFHPNIDRSAKQAFLRDLSVFSVPAHYGEAFGLYLLEAMAAGVPIVQPATGAFPEIIEVSGAGLITKASDPADLARGLEEVLLNSGLAEQFRRAARVAVESRYNIDAVGRHLVELYQRAHEPTRPAMAVS